MRSELGGLLEAGEAERIDRELARLLEEAESEPTRDAHKRILELLRQHDATLDWISLYLNLHCPPVEEKAKATRGYARLPGESGLPVPPGPKYRCPRNDYVWHRRTVGAPIPFCPTHGVLLEPSLSR